MDLKQITPLILTYNEAQNIRDTLERLRWAQEIAVVDSFSSDETLQIINEFVNVRLFQRKFDHFADQCNYGLSKIKTAWTLSMDADYKCPTELRDELEALDESLHGYQIRFRYCIFGRPLRAALYPPRVVLYRTQSASYRRDGHAHRVEISGAIGKIRTLMLHDDRKPLSTFCRAQVRYAADEAKKLASVPAAQLAWKDRIRLCYFAAPVLTLFYCLFWQLLILDGWPGIYYTMQRIFAELCLSMELLDNKLRRSGDLGSNRNQTLRESA